MKNISNLKIIKVPILPGRQFCIYVTGGVLSAIVDISIMQLIIGFQGPPFVAATIGFFSGLLFNYLFHANFTFRSTTSLPILLRFLLVVGINYLITLTLIYFSLTQFSFGALPGKIISLPIIAVNGYLMSKYWVFK